MEATEVVEATEATETHVGGSGGGGQRHGAEGGCGDKCESEFA